jgi:putative membrane protein
MILPGISGSYILLILGAYFFVLNAIKGSVESLLAGNVPLQQGSFVGLFILGAGIGILSFARLLGYLLDEYTSLTLAGLLGLMVGCLRGIWPFRAIEAGVSVNTLPTAFDTHVVHAMATFLIGVAIVATLTYFGAAPDSMETT